MQPSSPNLTDIKLTPAEHTNQNMIATMTLKLKKKIQYNILYLNYGSSELRSNAQTVIAIIVIIPMI